MQLFDEKSLFLVRKKLTLNDITQFTQSFQTTESGTPVSYTHLTLPTILRV